jgi:hypothetical protein
MELLTGIMTAFGLSASAGLNAYIPLLVVGLLGHYTELISLAKPWDTLANPWILLLLGVLVIIEMLADKIPAVNHINDVIQTAVRPVAGAIVFAASAQVVTDINPVLALASGLLVAGSVHAVKAGAVRPAITATTGGTANVPVSIAEDIISTIMSILAIIIPIMIGAIIVLTTSFIIWWLWRRVKRKQMQQA